MAEKAKQGAIGDSSGQDGAETDINGAGTAVGTPHPENRLKGQSVPAADFSDFELDDYDDDKQRGPDITTLPPDQDAGESFREITDVGEATRPHRERTDLTDNPEQSPQSTPTIDNQTNQPDRFHNDRTQNSGAKSS